MLRWSKAPVLLAISCLAPSAAFPEPGPIQESYRERPAIQSVPAMREPLSPEARLLRNRYYAAMVRMNANVVSVHPEEHIFYLGRDGEYLYDLATLLHGGNPQARDRLHLINISRTIYQDRTQRPLILRYLREQGLLARLERGERVVFVDTGWRGLLVQEIIAILREHYADNPTVLAGLRGEGGNISIHFGLASPRVESPEEALAFRVPSSRSFLASLDPEATRIDPTGRNTFFANRARIRAIENEVPHYTRTATKLAEVTSDVLGHPVTVVEPVSEGGGNSLEGIVRRHQLRVSVPLSRGWALGRNQPFWNGVLAAVEAGNRERVASELGRVIADWSNTRGVRREQDREAIEELEEGLANYLYHDRPSALTFMGDLRRWSQSAEALALSESESRWWSRFAGLERAAREGPVSERNHAKTSLVNFFRDSLGDRPDNAFLDRSVLGYEEVFAEARVRDALQQLEVTFGWNRPGRPRLTPGDVDPRLRADFVPADTLAAVRSRPAPVEAYLAHLRPVAAETHAARRLPECPLTDPETRRRTELALTELSAEHIPEAARTEGFRLLLTLASSDRVPEAIRQELMRRAYRSLPLVVDAAARAAWIDLVAHPNADVANLAAERIVNLAPELLTPQEAERLLEHSTQPEVLGERTLREALFDYARRRLDALNEPRWAAFLAELEGRQRITSRSLPPQSGGAAEEGISRFRTFRRKLCLDLFPALGI